MRATMRFRAQRGRSAWRRAAARYSRPHYSPPRCFYCVKPATVTRGAIRKGLFHASGDRFSSYGGGGAREVITRVRFGSFTAHRRTPPSNSVHCWWATFGWIVVSTIERLGKYCDSLYIYLYTRVRKNRFEIYRWIGFLFSFQMINLSIHSSSLINESLTHQICGRVYGLLLKQRFASRVISRNPVGAIAIYK